MLIAICILFEPLLFDYTHDTGVGDVAALSRQNSLFCETVYI
jgi:hypothetical protein